MTNESINILLIEDNPGDQELIRQMLHQIPDTDFHLDRAERLAVGLSLLDQKAFDIVLLDLSLPDSRGLETLSRLHAHAPDVPIVVLTGYNNGRIGVQAVQAGAQDYLVKGEVDSNLLVRALRYAIERHRAEETLRKREEEYRSLIDDVFDNASVAVFILDRDFKVVWINEATEQYFGLRREDVIGKDKRDLIRDTFPTLCDDAERFCKTLLSSYQKAIYTRGFICHVLPDAATGRKARWLEYWSQPIRAGSYAGGRIEQFMDVTDHKRVERAEREQRALAEALSD